MRFHKLIPILGLAVSFAQALLLPWATYRSIEQMVLLITKPDLIMDMTRPLNAMVKPGRIDSYVGLTAHDLLSTRKFDENSSSGQLLRSIAGYHNSAVPQHREIYQNAIYSRLVDLQKDTPNNKEQLKNLHDAMMHSDPNYLNNVEDPELRKTYQHIILSYLQRKPIPYLSTLDSSIPQKFKYLSVADVEKELINTMELHKTPPHLLHTPTHSNPSFPEPLVNFAAQPIAATA